MNVNACKIVSMGVVFGIFSVGFTADVFSVFSAGSWKLDGLLWSSLCLFQLSAFYFAVTMTFKAVTLKCHHCHVNLVTSNCDKFH